MQNNDTNIHNKKHPEAFSLAEVLITLVIIALLSLMTTKLIPPKEMHKVDKDVKGVFACSSEGYFFQEDGTLQDFVAAPSWSAGDCAAQLRRIIDENEIEDDVEFEVIVVGGGGGGGGATSRMVGSNDLVDEVNGFDQPLPNISYQCVIDSNDNKCNGDDDSLLDERGGTLIHAFSGDQSTYVIPRSGLYDIHIAAADPNRRGDSLFAQCYARITTEDYVNYGTSCIAPNMTTDKLFGVLRIVQAELPKGTTLKINKSPVGGSYFVSLPEFNGGSGLQELRFELHTTSYLVETIYVESSNGALNAANTTTISQSPKYTINYQNHNNSSLISSAIYQVTNGGNPFIGEFIARVNRRFTSSTPAVGPDGVHNEQCAYCHDVLVVHQEDRPLLEGGMVPDVGAGGGAGQVVMGVANARQIREGGAGFSIGIGGYGGRDGSRTTFTSGSGQFVANGGSAASEAGPSGTVQGVQGASPGSYGVGGRGGLPNRINGNTGLGFGSGGGGGSCTNFEGTGMCGNGGAGANGVVIITWDN